MLGSMNVGRMQIYTPMSLMRCRYSDIHKKNQIHCHVRRIMGCFILFPCHISSRIGHTQVACDTEGTSMLVQLRPVHEINLRGAPYELVPRYFVNSLLVLMTCDQRRLRRACSAFAQSRQGLTAHEHKVWSGPNKILDIYVRCVLNTWKSISYESGGFLSINIKCNNGYSYRNLRFLKMEHFNQQLSRSRRVLLFSCNCTRKVLRVYYRDSVRTDAHTKK